MDDGAGTVKEYDADCSRPVETTSQLPVSVFQRRSQTGLPAPDASCQGDTLPETVTACPYSTWPALAVAVTLVGVVVPRACAGAASTTPPVRLAASVVTRAPTRARTAWRRVLRRGRDRAGPCWYLIRPPE